MIKRIIGLLIVLLVIAIPASAITQTSQINGVYTVVRFDGAGTMSWTPPSGVSQVDYLVVGGGGEGGDGGTFSGTGEPYPGGGGGAGGVLTGSAYSVAGAQTVTVGAGGSTSSSLTPANGGNSVFSSITAIGGGSGGTVTSGNAVLPKTGGSGGGGAGTGQNGAAGTAGQGNTGSGGVYTLTGHPSGGGGGAGAAASVGNNGVGGNGGNGISSSITGTATYYGGGGGGGLKSPGTPGSGGAGCGGAGSLGTANAATCQGTGGGGGGAGAGSVTHGAGGSGVVIIRYVTPVAPVAAFSGTPTSGIAPLTVTFTDASTNTPTSWSWNFGDGQTSTVQSPSHVFSAAGSYTVSLVATNAAGSNTVTKTNYIVVTQPAPVASFTGNPLTGNAPLTVQFTDTSTNTPTSWSWNFGDGQTSTAKSPSHVYTTAGSYTVSLTATNAGGSNTVTKANNVVVSPPVPVASFTGTPLNGTAPLTVQFTDTSTNTPTSWSWNFGDTQTSTVQSPSHVYTTAGSYTVSLTATNAGGSNTVSRANYIVVVPPVPAASFTGTPLNGTVPLTVQFTDISTNTPTSWLWNFGDGQTSTVQNPSHVYTTAGSYTVSLTTTNAGGSNTATKPDYVIARLPAPVGSFTGTPLNGTVPLTVQFTDISTNTPTSWLWNFGDGQTSTVQNPSHVYTTAGSYTVSLTATNGDGPNTTTRTDYVTVLSVPTYTSSISLPSDAYLNQPGEDITIHLALDSAPEGLSGYNMNISLSNSSVAQITGVTFPSWASEMNSHGELPGTQNFLIRASDVSNNVASGATNIELASLTIRGISPGSTDIMISQTNVDNETGHDISVSVTTGNLIVDLPLDDPAIYDISPATGYTNSSVVIVLNGTGYRTDSGIRLTRPGEEIIPTDVVRDSRFRMHGTFDLVGKSEGMWNVTLFSPNGMNATLGNSFRIVRPLIPIQGMSVLPADLNGDGKTEDLNANGQMDYADVNIFFTQYEWIEANEPADSFNFDGINSLDLADVVELFNKIM
jgi:PKD repeat protein